MSPVGSSSLYSKCLVLVSLAAWARADPQRQSVPPGELITAWSSISPTTWLSVNSNDNIASSRNSSERLLLTNPLHDSQRMRRTQSAHRDSQSWRRKRRLAEPDRESLPGQDPQCDQFIHSVEVVQQRDPSVMADFFGMSTTQKRVKEYQFQTPNWPEPFPFEIDCIKIISAPTKHHRILLNFRGLFELEPEPNCMGDFLEVRDGAFGFSPLLGRFCSRRVPNVGNGIQTSGQYMWLRFRSDATIPHRGFQAVYRFYETSFDSPSDHVFRFRHRTDMQAGETWKLNQDFLLGNLQDYSQDLRHLPIEASFDIRSPNGTNIVIIVNHVKVPQPFSWTCNPQQLLRDNPRFRCQKMSPLPFAPTLDRRPLSGANIQLNKIALQDPSSVIDGRHTLFEVYDQWSISPYSPPCPRVRRFCDESVGLSEPEKSKTGRNFHFRHSRTVIRILLPSILEVPPKLNVTRKRRSLMKGRHTKAIITGRQAMLPFLEQMPEFDFQITVLSRTVRSRSNPCDENWVACDQDTCIPQKFWCDKISNCPQIQDEGKHCTLLVSDPNAIGPDGRRLADQGKSSYELRKEQEEQEAAATRQAAHKLHLSILGSLGLLLTIVTVTCVVMAIRRRKRSQVRVQAGKGPEPGPPSIEVKPVRLNHIMSVNAFNDKSTTLDPRRPPRSRPVFTLDKTNSIPERDDMVEVNQTNDQTGPGTGETGWNSTDSMNVPLLWHKPNTSSGKKSKTFSNQHTGPTGLPWNHMVPTNLLVHDPGLKRKDSASKLGRSPIKASGRIGPHLRSVAVAPMPDPSPAQAARLGLSPRSKATGVSGRPGVGRTAVSSQSELKALEPNRKIPVHGSPKEEHQWISGTNVGSVGPATPESAHLEHKSQMENKQSGQIRTTIQEGSCLSHQTSTDQHIPSCRLISRTQSWGGGLRLAGTEPFCNGEWEVTHSTDGYDPSNLLAINGTAHPNITAQNQIRVIEGKSPGRRTETGSSFRAMPVYRCRGVELPHLVSRQSHVSMPNVNGKLDKRGSGVAAPAWDDRLLVRMTALPTKRDFKPPSAKRPRISANRPELKNSEQQWIATSYGTDTEDDFSAGAVMLDESLSYPNNSLKAQTFEASSSSSTTANTSQMIAPELAVLRSIQNEANTRLLPLVVDAQHTEGIDLNRTPYLRNDGSRRLPVRGSPRTSTVSDVSTEDGLVGPLNEQAIDQSESEGFYRTSRVSQRYSSDSGDSSPKVIVYPGTEFVSEPMTPHYRPVIRRSGADGSAQCMDSGQTMGMSPYRSITDTGLPVRYHSRVSRIPNRSSADREHGESYVYEYEA